MCCRWVQLTACNFITPPPTHTRLMALCPGLPRCAGTRKAKPIWILLKQETVSGSGIIWAICKSAPCSRQRTMPAPHRSVFYRLDALPATQPTASKHWRHSALKTDAKCCNQHVCMPVCLYTRLLTYLKNTRPNFTKYSIPGTHCLTCGHGSALLWQQCNTSRNSSFVDDIKLGAPAHAGK